MSLGRVNQDSSFIFPIGYTCPLVVLTFISVCVQKAVLLACRDTASSLAEKLISLAKYHFTDLLQHVVLSLPGFQINIPYST